MTEIVQALVSRPISFDRSVQDDMVDQLRSAAPQELHLPVASAIQSVTALGLSLTRALEPATWEEYRE